MSIEVKKGKSVETVEDINVDTAVGTTNESQNTERPVALVETVETAETTETAVKAETAEPAETTDTTETAETANSKVIELDIGVETKPKKKALPAPKQKVPAIDFDIFIPRVKQLKGNIEPFSDEETTELALNKLTCDAYKSLKGVENTPAIACWVHLYNTVENGDVKLAKAICNLKKDFPGAMKYMLEQIKKIGDGGFEHNELFKFVEKYYFTKDKPKKNAKSEGAKSVKTDAKPTAPAKQKEKKQAASKVKAKEKTFTTKNEKKEEPLQLSLLM